MHRLQGDHKHHIPFIPVDLTKITHAWIMHSQLCIHMKHNVQFKACDTDRKVHFNVTLHMFFFLNFNFDVFLKGNGQEDPGGVKSKEK